MSIITVPYQNCEITIELHSFYQEPPNCNADNPYDFYGYTDIDFDIKSIKAMSYDEDGNSLNEVTVEYGTCKNDKEWQDVLWNNHGIDTDLADLDDVVDDYLTGCGNIK